MGRSGNHLRAETLEEVGRGRPGARGARACCGKRARNSGLSAADGTEVANPVAVDLLQGELNREQMCGLWTSREDTRSR